MVKCRGPYGCFQRYYYVGVVPQHLLLSEGQKKQLLDRVLLSLPEVNMSGEWKLLDDRLTVQPKADRWIGHVQLYLGDTRQLPPSQNCGVYGQIDVDLETLEVLDMSNIIPPLSDVKCVASHSRNDNAIQDTTTATIPSLTVSTEKVSYTSRDVVSISGRALPVDHSPLVIRVFAPDGRIYRYDQLLAAYPDGSYSYMFKITGKLGVSGMYKVVVTHSGLTAETTFFFWQTTTSYPSSSVLPP
jgi:hypothetical protein